MTEPLTLEDIAQLRDVGPTRYREHVISLFASGQATEAQWAALATLLACQPGQGQLVLALQRFRDQRARQQEWLALADLVLAWSESATGDLVACIDRGVLARYAAHEAGRDAWERWQVG